MNKRVLWALVLIAATVVVLLFNLKTVTVNVLLTKVEAMAALVYLCFAGVGVVIGLLLK